jgi:hypothetical protein
LSTDRLDANISKRQLNTARSTGQSAIRFGAQRERLRRAHAITGDELEEIQPKSFSVIDRLL